MDYFILDHNNKPCGPFTLFQLRGMGLTRKSYVWARGWDKWIHAGDVEEINKYVLHTPKAAPTPERSVAGRSATPSGQETKSSAAHSGQKRLFACMAILFVLVCLLTSTNPNIFAHRREARPVVEEAVEADINSGHSNTTDYPNGTSVDRIFDATLVYHNYYLFSTTTVQLRQTTHFLSFGILGHVFTTSVGSL